MTACRSVGLGQHPDQFMVFRQITECRDPDIPSAGKEYPHGRLKSEGRGADSTPFRRRAMGASGLGGRFLEKPPEDCVEHLQRRH